VFAALLTFVVVNGAAAQIAPPASPFLSHEHWSHAVLRRLDHSGVLPRGADLGRETIPQEEIAAMLAVADSALGTRYLEQFRAEFKAPKPSGFTFVQEDAVAGYRAVEDAYAPGIGFDSIAWTGARPIDNDADFFYSAGVGLTWGRHLALGFGGDVQDDIEVQFVTTAGYFGAWLGWRTLGYGVGDGGGIVVNDYLNNHPRFPMWGVFLPRPLRVPLLGPVRVEMHLGKVENVLNLQQQQNEIDAWFWMARGSFEPFSHLRVGINRAMIFGGEGNTPVTFSRVAKNIIGIYTDDDESNFANQIISIDFRLRIPGVPLTAYLDWGSDDAAGGWWDVPGMLAGAEYARVTAKYDVAVGAEHLQLSRSCCGNSIWYRNAWFRGGWADDEQIIGHPLGGHGREWRVFANGSVGAGRFNGDVALYARRRRAENLLVPAWEGKSTGVEAGLDVEITSPVRVRLDAEIERGGNDWTTSRLLAAIRYRL
jgi:hypothetical protein